MQKGRQVQFILPIARFLALPYNIDDLDPEMNKSNTIAAELNKCNMKTYLHIDL